MAQPANNSPKRMLPSENPSSPKKIKQVHFPEIGPFKREIEESLNRFVQHKMMCREEIAGFTATIIDSTVLSTKSCETWCAHTLIAISEKIRSLSEQRFVGLKQPYPATVKVDTFGQCIVKFTERYIECIKNSLREAANADLKEKELVVTCSGPFLIFRITDRNKGTQILKLIQTLSNFFQGREYLFETIQIADELERVIHHAWNEENIYLKPLEEGFKILELCKRLCKLMHKGDFSFQKERWLKRLDLEKESEPDADADYPSIFKILHKAITSRKAPESIRDMDDIINLAGRFKFKDLESKYFHQLLFHLNNAPNIMHILEIEQQLRLAPALQLHWQVERDLWVSEWLSHGNMTDICHYWVRQQVQQGLPSWQYVQSLILQSIVEPQIIALVSKLPHLKKLQLENLTHLDIQPGNFSALTTFKLSSELEFNIRNISILQSILKLPSLQTLDLTCRDIRALAEFLSQQQSTSELRLYIPTPLSDDDETILTNLPMLKTLDVTSRSLEPLISLRQVEELKLRLIGTPEKEDFANFGLLPPIQLLEVREKWGSRLKKLEEVLQKLPHLKILCLGRTACVYLCLDKVILPPLEVLELRLRENELSLLHELIQHPLNMLTIFLAETMPVNILPQLQKVFSQKLLFSQTLQIVGAWVLGGTICTKFIYSVQKEMITLVLKDKLENIEKTLQELIRPCFPNVTKFKIHHEKAEESYYLMLSEENNFIKVL